MSIKNNHLSILSPKESNNHLEQRLTLSTKWFLFVTIELQTLKQKLNVLVEERKQKESDIKLQFNNACGLLEHPVLLGIVWEGSGSGGKWNPAGSI
jgi:hypothetical protein